MGQRRDHSRVRLTDFLPLTPAIVHILLALADRERHGYGIMLEVERITQGATRMGPGTLYGTIQRLQASRLIEESDARPDPELDDERRRYYRLTARGRAVLRAETERLDALVQQARRKGIVPLRRRSGRAARRPAFSRPR